jgi:hypothetical protein
MEIPTMASDILRFQTPDEDMHAEASACTASLGDKLQRLAVLHPSAVITIDGIVESLLIASIRAQRRRGPLKATRKKD